MKYILLLLMLLPAAYASDWCNVNSTCELWADSFSGASYYDAAEANITIRTPAGVATYAAMNKIDTGLFQIAFTPTATGNWYAVVQYFNTTQQVAIASQSFAIRDIAAQTPTITTYSEEGLAYLWGGMAVIAAIFAIYFIFLGMARRKN